MKERNAFGEESGGGISALQKGGEEIPCLLGKSFFVRKKARRGREDDRSKKRKRPQKHFRIPI